MTSATELNHRTVVEGHGDGNSGKLPLQSVEDGVLREGRAAGR